MQEKNKSSEEQSINKKKAHHNLIHNTMIEVQEAFPQGRLFRTEPTLARQFHTGRVMKFGVAGSPDIYGWIPVGGVAVYTGIEIKTGKAKMSPEQRDMGMLIRARGGIFVVGREEIYQTVKDVINQTEVISRKMVNFTIHGT